jgi:hypothetical protein
MHVPSGPYFRYYRQLRINSDRKKGLIAKYKYLVCLFHLVVILIILSITKETFLEERKLFKKPFL